MARTKTNNSQQEAVLNHLMRNKLTSMEAFENYGITRLSAIIFRLRNEGYNINTNICYTTNRYGNTCKYAEYILVK